LLDEPTSAQDLGQQHRMLALVKDLAKAHDYGVIVILHDLNLALRYSDDCLLLGGGGIAGSGPTEAVLTARTISRFWGYEARVLRTADGHALVA